MAGTEDDNWRRPFQSKFNADFFPDYESGAVLAQRTVSTDDQEVRRLISYSAT